MAGPCYAVSCSGPANHEGKMKRGVKALLKLRSRSEAGSLHTVMDWAHSHEEQRLRSETFGCPAGPQRQCQGHRAACITERKRHGGRLNTPAADSVRLPRRQSLAVNHTAFIAESVLFVGVPGLASHRRSAPHFHYQEQAANNYHTGTNKVAAAGGCDFVRNPSPQIFSI